MQGNRGSFFQQGTARFRQVQTIFPVIILTGPAFDLPFLFRDTIFPTRYP